MNSSYLAGLFDGEGSVTIHERHAQGYSHILARVQIAMTSWTAVNEFRKAFGGTVHRVSRKTKNGHQVYYWQATGLRLLQFAWELVPYLKVKRTQVCLARDYCYHVAQLNSRGKRLTSKELKWRRSCIKQCKRLNAQT